MTIVTKGPTMAMQKMTKTMRIAASVDNLVDTSKPDHITQFFPPAHATISNNHLSPGSGLRDREAPRTGGDG